LCSRANQGGQGDGRGVECIDLRLQGSRGNGDVINLRLERAGRGSNRREINDEVGDPASGIPVNREPFPPKALAGFVAVTVLVKVFIPVKVCVDAS